MNNNSAYYIQNRKGKRIKVRKGRNRLNVYNGTKVKRAVVRGSVPIKNGEIYGKGVISVGDRSSSIKKTQGVAINTKKGGVKVTGRTGSVKGGLVIAKRKGNKTDRIAYSISQGTDTAAFAKDKRSKEYNKKMAMKAYKSGKPGLLEKAGIIPNRKASSATYKRRSKKGKVFMVRKGNRSKANGMLVRSAELLGTAGGLIAGAKLGQKVTQLAGVNGTIRNTAMVSGGLAGGAIALMLADRLEQKYGK